MTGWRLAAVLGLVALYAVASHLLMTHASNHPWTVAALFGPLLAAAAWSGWHTKQPRLLLGCAVALVVLVGVVARGGVDDVNRLYVLQHAGIHLALAFTFGITLRAGATPLIVAMGEKVHRVFTAEMRAYARRLTAAWVIYFHRDGRRLGDRLRAGAVAVVVVLLQPAHAGRRRGLLRR